MVSNGKNLHTVSIQPFREEISRVIAIYLAEGSPRELNLSSRDRSAVLKALALTTHPSAMKRVAKHIEDLLRLQAHPNFIRWSIANGNAPRGTFAVVVGVILLFTGLIAAITLTLGSASRKWRALGSIGWVIGTASVYAGWRGMCVIMHSFHRRQIRPWELWAAENDGENGMKSRQSVGTDATLSSTTNSYEDEVHLTQESSFEY